MAIQGRNGRALIRDRAVLAGILLGLACLTPSFASAAPRPTLGPGGPLPLAFEPNQGQADQGVRFLARGRGYGLFLSPTESVLVLTPPNPAGSVARRPQAVVPAALPPTVVRMRLVGADPDATISGVDALPGRNHYLIGDTSRWQRNVPTFARVRYSDVYPGISLIFYGSDRELEYDFVVAPGADPNAVVLAFDGADGLRVDGDGHLILATRAGDLRLRRPVIYQEIDGVRQPVDGGYVLEDGRVRFRVAAFDAARSLVIDPVLGYSTYLGGSSNDQAFGVAVDSLGNTYVTGTTLSTDFPLGTSPVQATRAGVGDVFVTKLDASGTTILYSTFIGGSGDDAGNAIAVDSLGAAYVTGLTTSNNFPVAGVNPFQTTTRGGDEAFVAKLDVDGSSLVYSTYLGSNSGDFAFGIAVDDSGNAFVTGVTAAPTFPNNNAIPCNGTKRTGNDAFVARLNSLGSTLLYCTFLGGAGDDSGNAIALDTNGNVYVAGTTSSTDFPFFNGVQGTLGGGLDGFAVKLDPLGLVLYATFLGGSLDDEALAIAVDTAGNAYVAGSTASTNFPTLAPLQPLRAGLTDAFVAKLAPTGDALVFSTYLGGFNNDIANGIAVHPVDFTIYVTGSTASIDFPNISSVQTALAGGLDAFVTKLNAAGSTIIYSTFIGGTGDDTAQGIAVNADGIAFITGSTNSTAFPTVAPIQPATGLLDAFVTQVSDGGIIQFSGLTYVINENGGTATITVQRTGDTSQPASVEFLTSDGTATAGADYLAAGGTLTFAPGQIVNTFTVNILDDTIAECDETVNLTLRNPTGGAVLGTRRTATLNILDNEPSINFSLATFSVNEHQGPAVITVNRCGPAGGVVTVQFSTADGSATAGADYTTTVRTLTFGANVRVATVTVPIINDTLAESTETVNLLLSGVSGGVPPALLGLRSSALLNIVDNDLTGSVQFSKPTFTVNENGASALITVTRTNGAASNVVIDYAASDGTAVAGSDFTAVPGTLTFGAGVASQTFSVTILDDGLAEGNETVILTLMATPAVNVPPGGAVATLGSPSTATLTIVDNEPTMSFSTDTFTVKEGAASATITVVRRGSTAGAATVDFTTTDGSALADTDYKAVAGTLAFGAGVASRTFTVPILNDTASRGARSLLLTLGNATGAGTIVPPSQATLTITDDDVAGTIQFSAPAYDAAENSGSATVTVTRSGGTASGATVQYTTVDGTALAGVDYTFASDTVTFGAGETVKTFPVPIVDDGAAEGVETVNLQLSSPGGGATLGARSTAVLRIIDDEQTVRFSATGYSVLENGASAAIVVQRLGTPTGVVTARFATSNGTATAGVGLNDDYTAVTRTLTFGPGVRSQTVLVPVRNNTFVDGARALNLTLDTVTGAALTCSGAVVASCTVPLTIVDDDQAGTVQFSLANYTVTEGTATVTVVLTRTGGTGGPVAVHLKTLDGQGTATATLDYTPVDRDVVFNAGVASVSVPITIANDTLAETPETILLQLTGPTGGGEPAFIGGRNTATITINDTDVAGVVQFSQALYTVSEAGGAATITVTRTGGAASGVFVEFTTANGVGPMGAISGTHYTGTTSPVSVTFTAGLMSRTVTVPVIDVPSGDGSKFVTLMLANPAGRATLGARSTAQLKIIDNEATVQFAAPTFSVAEGVAATVTVERTGPAGLPGTVLIDFVTTDGTGVAPGDYRTTTGRLTFGPGVASRIFTVPTTANVQQDGNRTFNVTLIPVVAAPVTVGAQGIAQVTIMDNDVAGTLGFFGSPYRSSEFSSIPVSVRRASAAGPVTVAYTTVDGTAKANIDYVPKSGVLTFAPGVFVANFSVAVLPNTRDDGDRSFTIELSAPTGGATLGAARTGTVIIADNDVGGAIQFLLATNSVSECAALPCDALLTVLRKGGGASGVSIDFATIDGTATALSDYVPTTGTVTFAADQLSQTIRIPLQIEPGAQPTKSFSVILTNPRGGGTLGPITVTTVNITDTR